MQQSDVNEIRKFVDEKMEEFKLSVDGFINSYNIKDKNGIGIDTLDKRLKVLVLISKWSLGNDLNITVDQGLKLIDELSFEIKELKS